MRHSDTSRVRNFDRFNGQKSPPARLQQTPDMVEIHHTGERTKGHISSRGLVFSLEIYFPGEPDTWPEKKVLRRRGPTAQFQRLFRAINFCQPVRFMRTRSPVERRTHPSVRPSR